MKREIRTKKKFLAPWAKHACVAVLYSALLQALKGRTLILSVMGSQHRADLNFCVGSSRVRAERYNIFLSRVIG